MLAILIVNPLNRIDSSLFGDRELITPQSAWKLLEPATIRRDQPALHDRDEAHSVR